MLCALITVSQFAGILILSLSLSMMLGDENPRVHQDAVLIAPQAGPWVYPSPRLSGASIRLCPAFSLA